jgi:hypothetical protein
VVVSWLSPWRRISAEFTMPCTNLGLSVYWDLNRYGWWHLDYGDAGQVHCGRLAVVWSIAPPPPSGFADAVEPRAMECV